MTSQDLQDHNAITRTPVNITNRGNRVFSTIAPSSGAVVPSALKNFEGFPRADGPDYDITIHRPIWAMRFGYELRGPRLYANVSPLERLSDRR